MGVHASSPNSTASSAGCRLGAEADEVVVHELATDETVISMFVTFEVAGRISLYQSARLTDPDGAKPRSCCCQAIITDACDRGLTEVDFLRGDEPYKHRFAPMRDASSSRSRRPKEWWGAPARRPGCAVLGPARGRAVLSCRSRRMRRVPG